MLPYSFKVNDNTARLLDELKLAFGVDSRADAIRRALALARIVASHAGAERTVVIKGAGEAEDRAETIRLAF